MLNSVSYSIFIKDAQIKEAYVHLFTGTYEQKQFDRNKRNQENASKIQTKQAFINPLSAIKPITGNLARTAIGSGKNLLKDSWKGLSGMDKTLTVGLPLATTLPGMFNKQDQMGNSRAERLSATAGNVTGGVVGTHLGNQLAKKITTKMPGRLGGVLGFASSVAGGIGGSMLGEGVGKTPFKAFKPTPTPSYGLQGSQTQSQMQAPQQAIS